MNKSNNTRCQIQGYDKYVGDTKVEEARLLKY